MPGLKQLNVPGVGIFAIDFNNNNTNKALRQAIAYAINRPEIIDKVLGGLATLNYTIPPGFKVYDDINKYDFDLAKAKAAQAVRAGTSARPSGSPTSPAIRISQSRPRRSSSTSRQSA